jgi:adenylate cyclase
MLLDHGATVDEVRAAAGSGQPGLAALNIALELYPPGRLEMADAASKANVSVDDVRRWWHDLGWPDPTRSGAKLNEAELRLLQIFAERFPQGLLPLEVISDFLRTATNSVAAIAESMLNTLRIGIDQPARARGASAVEVAEMHRGILQLFLPDFFETIQILFRRAVVEGAGADVTISRVGEVWSERTMVFVDLVDYSTLAQGGSAHLAEVLDGFEQAVAGCATDYGGRLVKLLGDGAMLTFASRESAIGAASSVVDDPTLPPCRAGVATGAVMLRHADYFGPVVNLASRLAEVVDAGSVAIDDSVEVAGATRMAPTQLKGLEKPVTPYRIGE